jgi:hypothetical protein
VILTAGTSAAEEYAYAADIEKKRSRKRGPSYFTEGPTSSKLFKIKLFSETSNLSSCIFFYFFLFFF